MIPVTYAGDIISPDAFRVSDEYVEQYPNGVLEFATVQFETSEDASEFDVIIVRRGGTKGKVEVDFKVIEVTARYGDDFTVLVPKWYGDTALRKTINSPTLLESALEENKDGILTSPKYLDEEQSSGVTPTAIQMTLPEEESQEEYTELSTEYKSTLHRLRDEATGEKTKAPDPIDLQKNYFDIENPEYIQAGDALNTLMPGVTGRLTFQDGENYKTFKIRIKDDDIFEGQEQFILGLFNPTNNAVLGDTFNATCNITDNDTGVGQVIGFDQEIYSVSAEVEYAELIIQRTGDIHTYSKIEISTLSGTAKADEHYAPVILETIFLPGETNKKVHVPLFAENAKDPIDFYMVITQDGKPVTGINRATIRLIPEESTNDVSLMSVQAENRFQANAVRINYLYVPGNAFALGSSVYSDNQGRTYTGNDAIPWGTDGKQIIMEESRWAPMGRSSLYKWVDLVGISGITINWKNTGTSQYNQSTILINDKEYYRLKGSFNGDTYLGAANNFPRIMTVLQVVNNTNGCYGNLGVWSLKLHRQQFEVVVENAPTLVYNTWDGQTKRASQPFNPGTVMPSVPRPYKDDIITLIPRIYQEGELRGVRYAGYQVKTANGYTGTIRSDTIKLSSEFIKANIYGNGTVERQEKLIIRPVFERTEASLHIKEYEYNRGELFIAGQRYNNQMFDTNGFLSGDVLIGEMIPKTGYSADGYREYLTDAGGATELKPIPVNIILANKNLNQQIEPVFKETIKSVPIEWKPLGITFFETREENIVKGMIFHDHRDYMPEVESDLLYSGVPEVVTPRFDDYAQIIDYQRAMDEYQINMTQREEKIRQNYDRYRQTFDVYTLEKLPVGEIVTLYGKPVVEGYTIAWWMEEDRTEDNGNHTTDVVHIGSNFSFVVTENPQKVCYCFVAINRPGNSVLTGKVVQSKNTIKNQKASAVNINDPLTYTGVPGVTVSVAVADSRYTFVVVDGIKYETSAVTSNDGSFAIYVPYGVNNFYYSIKMTRGDIVETRSVTIKNPMNIEIPFMDSFKIDQLEISVDNVLQDKINIEDRPMDIRMKTVSYDNRSVSKVRLRSYDSAGYLWQTLDAEYIGTDEWLIRTNTKETFKLAGRFTLEIYDERGIGHGEIESGYNIDELPVPGLVDLGTLSVPPGVNLYPFGEINPQVDFGTTRSLIPVQTSPNAQTYSIAVGVGELLKQVVTDNPQGFDDETIQQKAMILSQYLSDGRYSSNLLNKSWNNSKGSSKSGPGKGSITVDFDIGFYIQLTRKTDGLRNDFYFDYAMIYVGCKVEAKQDVNASVCGVPVYMTVKGGGKVRGLMMAQGGDDTRLLSAYGFFPLPDNYIGVEYFGMYYFNLNFSIGTGIGYRGPAAIGIEGVMDVDMVYQPWEDGYGTLTFSLNVDIDVLMIPMKFNIAKSEHQLFKSDNYIDNDWLPVLMNNQFNAMNREGTSRISTLERANNSAWNTLPDAENAGIREIETTTLQTGIYKHPQPQLVALNNGKMILFFINDDGEREGYDRTALYYSVYDGYWNPPVLLQDDGTADYDPYVKEIGDRLLVLWSSSNTQFGDVRPSMSDLLNSTDIYSQWFDLDGAKSGETMRITFDDGAYGNMSPEAVYDRETETVMLLYQKTDYKTEGVSFDDNVLSIGDYLNNSYNTIAYRLYVNGEWITSYEAGETSYINYEQINGSGSLYGQRFLDLSIGKIDPTVSEIAATTQQGMACIAYTVDLDNNPYTKDDTELFMLTYNFAEKSFTSPAGITNNQVEDSNPQVSEDCLFWNCDGYISYLNWYTFMSTSSIDSVDEQSFLRVLNEKNIEAAQSFTVTSGQDGNRYIVWSEINKILSDFEGVDPISERQLYAAMYDARMSQVGLDENMQPIYVGGWGSKQKITEKVGEYNNEQSVVVDSQGMVTIANRKYEMIDDANTPEPDRTESDTSSLVIRRFEPKTTLMISASDITTYPEFPKAQEQVMLTVNARNEGFKPSDKVTFRFELYDKDQGWVQYGEDNIVYSHLASDGIVSADTSFIMPEDYSDENPVKLRVTAWEENYTSTSSVEHIVITPKENLVLNQCNGELLNCDMVKITGNVLNTGSKAADDVEVTIEVPDKTTGEIKVIKMLSYDRVDTSNILDINEIFLVPDIDFDKDDIMKFIIRVKETVNNEQITFATNTVVVAQPKSWNTQISEIQINNNQPISLKTGTVKNTDARILPSGAISQYRLQYTSLNPDIATIDYVNGTITGVSKGTAEILVEAVRFENAYFCDLNNRLFDSNGNLIEFNEDGSLKNIPDAENNDTVMASKSVFITVTDSQADSEPDPEPAIEPVTDLSSVMRTEKEGNQIILHLNENSALRYTDIYGTLNRLKNQIQEMDLLKIVIENSEFTMESEALKILAEAGMDLVISLNGVDVTLNQQILNQISQQDNNNVTIGINKSESSDNRPIIDVELTSNGKPITGFSDQEIIISIPYTLKDGENENAIVVYYINGDESIVIPNGRYKDGYVSFAVNHLSQFLVGYNYVSFADGKGWAEEYITYLASREIINGTGNGLFQPQNNVTRAEFVKMTALLTEKSIPKASQSHFEDVAETEWFAPYVAWAFEKGYIVGKTETTFAPMDFITREQMAVIIERFLKSKSYHLSMHQPNSFIDDADISEYAKGAVRLLSGLDIISGKDGNRFDPKGYATRAESAKILALLLRIK